MRTRENQRHKVLASFKPEDSLIRMPISPRARQQLRPYLLESWQARWIRVQFAGQRQRFIASLCDAKRCLPKVLAALYRQRWKIKLCGSGRSSNHCKRANWCSSKPVSLDCRPDVSAAPTQGR